MIIYEALYNSMTEESSFATLSLHRTREGAEKAIEKSKQEIKKEFDERMARMDKEYYELVKDSWQWDNFKAWAIRETELLD